MAAGLRNKLNFSFIKKAGNHFLLFFWSLSRYTFQNFSEWQAKPKSQKSFRWSLFGTSFCSAIRLPGFPLLSGLFDKKC
jgi:hypothetical protein